MGQEWNYIFALVCAQNHCARKIIVRYRMMTVYLSLLAGYTNHNIGGK